MNTPKLVERIADKLITMIQENAYKAGDKLPTEGELCKQLEAGRNTIREALKILASRNIIVIRQGAGSFIANKPGVIEDPFGFAMVNDREKLTRDLLQIRILLEPSIASLAAQYATESDIAKVEEALLTLEDTMRKREDYAADDVRYHQSIAECTHNIVMENLIPIISNGIIVFAKEVGHTEYEDTQVSHRKIFSYIRNHQPFEAEMEMRFHLLYNYNRYQVKK